MYHHSSPRSKRTCLKKPVLPPLLSGSYKPRPGAEHRTSVCIARSILVVVTPACSIVARNVLATCSNFPLRTAGPNCLKLPRSHQVGTILPAPLSIQLLLLSPRVAACPEQAPRPLLLSSSHRIGRIETSKFYCCTVGCNRNTTGTAVLRLAYISLVVWRSRRAHLATHSSLPHAQVFMELNHLDLEAKPLKRKPVGVVHIIKDFSSAH